MVKYSEIWDLDVFFEGGTAGEPVKAHMKQLKERTLALREGLEQLKGQPVDTVQFTAYLNELADVAKAMRQVGAFASCTISANTKDEHAPALQGEISAIGATYSEIRLAVNHYLASISDEEWEQLLASEGLQALTFVLNEWRDSIQDLAAADVENAMTNLSIDGYHAWGQLYSQVVGDLSITMTVDGEEKTLSVGQANNLSSHEEESIRRTAYEKLEKVWAANEQLFASILNRLAGFRLKVYEQRGWDDVLYEPLKINRMSKDTLSAMWTAIENGKQPFVDYLYKKASLLGKEKMDWFDLDAPVTDETIDMSFDEGAAFILEQFKKFGPKKYEFAKQAFEDAWIEAEDRANKRPGGFCTSFPESDQSRIFMTYSGSMSNVATLAHELGHAYHSFALRPVHYFNRSYAMGVAETASTFAEMIVADAAVKAAETKEQKISLLEDKIQRSVAFFMNIHACFLFETKFYEERKQGLVSAERLNELMSEAQQKAYGEALATTEPHFWASKLHFFITGTPFYNFPYTFGYLFSLSIYAKSLEEGGNFEEKYIAFLQDTASMTIEDLAMKHLGEDVTKESFWAKGVALCVKDVEQFLELID